MSWYLKYWASIIDLKQKENTRLNKLGQRLPKIQDYQNHIGKKENLHKQG